MNGIGGIDFLCRGLARHLQIELAARVTDVEERDAGVAVAWTRPGQPDRVELADHCVIALGAHATAAIHCGLREEERQILTTLPYQDLMSLQIALTRPPAEPAAAITLPRTEHHDLCAIIVDHNKAPDRAPAGRGLLGAYWDPGWVARYWDVDDATIAQDGVEAVARILPEVAATVAFTTVHRFPHGVLVSHPGTYRRLRRFHEIYPLRSRIQLAGDYVGGSTTNSALCSGERAARRVIGR